MEAANNIIAPFVLKTYQMVNDPKIDGLIAWGTANNSFIVVDPLEFSQRILPIYFKHNNFSSFVRQLNTYGFRKVDPDKWEFANEWFLRGQTHLLKNIVRRKHNRSSYHRQSTTDESEDEEILTEISKLKQEQKALEQEVENMARRLEATEKRPQQMMAFLCKVVEDPEILPRILLEKERCKRLSLNNREKKRRLMISNNNSTTSSVKSEEEVGGPVVGTVSSFHSPNANFDKDTFCQSSPSSETPWRSQSGMPMINYETYGSRSAMSSSMSSGSSESGGFTAAAPPSEAFSGYYVGEGSVAATEEVSPPPYPFSLLGGGF